MNNRQHDIERYLRGDMSPAERHALERAALSDPFLADALEGAEAGHGHFKLDVEELQRSVYARTKRRGKPRIISLWNWSLGIAAGLIAVAVAGVFLISKIQREQEARRLASLDAQSEQELSLIRGTNAVDSLSVFLPRGERRRQQVTYQVIAEQSPRPGRRQREVAVALSEPPAISPVVEAEQADEETIDNRPRKTVRGRVTTTEDGSALAGVNVVVKGTREGTITDAMGVFEIEVPEGESLSFSYIGMESKELDVSVQQDLEIALQPDYAQLSEVVVTGDALPSNNHPLFEMAAPMGGKEAFQEYIEQQMQYPKQALDNKVEGKVTVQFTVGSNGQLSDFKVIKGIGHGCEDEVIRLIKQGPAWLPTTANKKKVNEKVKVRVNFDLPD